MQDSINAPLGWAFQKESELAECFNYNLRKMDEAGILSLLLHKTKTKFNEDFGDVHFDLSISVFLFTSYISSHWKKSQVPRLFGCCTADSQADKYRNQLNNNLKIDELETLTKVDIGFYET